MSPHQTRVRFGPESIRLDQQADDWKQAVLQAGEVLHGIGATLEGYGERMVRVIDTFGPYVVVGPGVALVHARPDRDVLHNAAALLIFREGVPFGHPDNDPVRIVVALAVTRPEDHVAIIAALANVIDAEGIVDRILHCATSPQRLAERVIETLRPLNVVDAGGGAVRRRLD